MSTINQKAEEGKRKMENQFCSTDSVSSLLCQETSCFGEEEEDDTSLTSLITSNGSFTDLEEYVHLLLEKEKEKEKINSSLLTTNNFVFLPKTYRLNAINYILDTKELLGFELETAYLSVTYLDRFLSLRTLEGEKPWAMQLLSVGCLSLATKMQESNAWGLSSFQGGEFKFDAKAIQRMEILIMYTLKWKLGSTTPLAFLQYFIHILFATPPPWSTLTRILEHIIAFMKDANLMDHYPSAIALAAILLSLDQRLTRNTIELKINVISCRGFLDLDDIFSCYHIMQQSEKDQSKIPNFLASPGLSPISISRIVSFQNSSSTSLIGSKRKRLTFDDTDDQNRGLVDKQPRG